MFPVLIVVLSLTHFFVCEGTTTSSTPTSLPALLTGNCTATTTTWAYISTYTPTRATTTNLISGDLLQSVYSTSSAEVTAYTFFTLGCQSSSLSCCPSAAVSTITETGAGTLYYSIKALTACPSDYATTVDQSYTIGKDGLIQTLSPTTLCCPSSWEIWPTQFANIEDTKPCYQPWPPNAIITPALGYDVWETGPDGVSQVTPDYQIIVANPRVGLTEVTLGVRMIRSYELGRAENRGKDKLGTGAIVGIAVAVPLSCLFVGIGLLYRLHKYRERRTQEKKKKSETSEKGPGMPELGQGLRHELEPGKQMPIPARKETGAEEVEGRHISEMQDATLGSPWSDGPLHELPSKEIKELDGNTPAAHEVVAEDWRIVP